MSYKIPKILVCLFFAFLALVFLFYYLVLYPKNVITQARSTLKKGQHIAWYLDKDSHFFQMLEDSKVQELVFRNSKNKICSTYKISEVDKNEDDLLGNTFETSSCSKLCLSLIPSRFVRGNFCIYLDKEMKITSVEKPLFWINYRSSKL